MSTTTAQAPLTKEDNPALHAELRARAGSAGVLSFRDFMAVALYAPELGYYAQAGRTRVGRRPEADFYTAASLAGGVFGQLVRAAAVNLLGAEEAGRHTLVEIGAEPGGGIFGGATAPFAGLETRRLGEALTLPERAVVFANEVLDAQPFHRLVFRRGGWRELGVRVDGAAPAEVELAELSAPVQAMAAELPVAADEDYHLDLPLGAEEFARALAAPRWQGLLILADYGYDWHDLACQRPGGTARAYAGHAATGDLLARPGGQDLTCHVCWDRLERVLEEGGFTVAGVERQEAFLLKNAGALVEALLREGAGGRTQAQATLLELLHPAHLGHKFQVLTARRA